VLADVGGLRGATVVPGEPRAPLRLEGLTLEAGGRLLTVVANLADRPTEAVVAGGPGAAWVRTLDRTSVERACREPARFREERGVRVASRGGELGLELAPYAIARIDWE
jgi:hypothetical protein